MSIEWLDESMVLALHDEHLAEHGGPTGIRDLGSLQSALSRAKNLVAYADPDIPALAAAYGFGIVRNHPFVDGNKRTAFVVTELFLALNGYELIAENAACVGTMLSLADGSLSEDAFVAWLRVNAVLIRTD